MPHAAVGHARKHADAGPRRCRLRNTDGRNGRRVGRRLHRSHLAQERLDLESLHEVAHADIAEERKSRSTAVVHIEQLNKQVQPFRLRHRVRFLPFGSEHQRKPQGAEPLVVVVASARREGHHEVRFEGDHLLERNRGAVPDLGNFARGHARIEGAIGNVAAFAHGDNAVGDTEARKVTDMRRGKRHHLLHREAQDRRIRPSRGETALVQVGTVARRFGGIEHHETLHDRVATDDGTDFRHVDTAELAHPQQAAERAEVLGFLGTGLGQGVSLRSRSRILGNRPGLSIILLTVPATREHGAQKQRDRGRNPEKGQPAPQERSKKCT